jgi:hypothetical protein
VFDGNWWIRSTDLLGTAEDILRDNGRLRGLEPGRREEAIRTLAADTASTVHKAGIRTFGDLAANVNELPQLIPDDGQRAVLERAASEL